MNIITYLEQLKPTMIIKIFLYENNYLQMIADTTVEILLQSTKQTFRQLNVLAVGNEEDKVVLTVIRPTEI